MARLVAFLGGINVGGHRVAMDRLRSEFVELGFSNVATFIASGNVMFDARGGVGALEAQIEHHLGEQLGWPVPTFLRRASEVQAVVEFADSKPFGKVKDGHTHMVALTTAVVDASRQAELTRHTSAANRFHVNEREVHWLIAGKMSESVITLSKLAKLIGRNTTRNITSLRRLADLL